MTTATPFEKAWLLIKGQPLGIKFTTQEEQFITKTLHSALNSTDYLQKDEAKRLYSEFLNHT